MQLNCRIPVNFTQTFVSEKKKLYSYLKMLNMHQVTCLFPTGHVFDWIEEPWNTAHKLNISFFCSLVESITILLLMHSLLNPLLNIHFKGLFVLDLALKIFGGGLYLYWINT